jgi:hypothetical protein
MPLLLLSLQLQPADMPVAFRYRDPMSQVTTPFYVSNMKLALLETIVLKKLNEGPLYITGLNHGHEELHLLEFTSIELFYAKERTGPKRTQISWRSGHTV